METTATAAEPALTKRRLILRDSLAFAGLALVTLTLFGLTFFLFRSFTAHRAVLAQRWLDRGKVSLATGHPQQAVNALEVTLDYAPDDQSAKFLLAQALAEAGHEEQANNYFTELWEAAPGSGVLNLQLARVAAKRGDHQEAINFYRAAIYGTWEGDGTERRREIRLELARYLLAVAEPDAARAELLIASGNVSGDARADTIIAGLLEQAHDSSGARHLYLRAAAESPAQRASALAAAARIDFATDEFGAARDLYLQAENAVGTSLPPLSPDARVEITQQMQLLEKVLELSPHRDLLPDERVRRILLDRDLAGALLGACQPATPASVLEIAALRARWSGRYALPDRRALLRRPEWQDASIALTNKTALATERLCSATPAALTTEQQALLLVAKSGKGPAS